VTAMLEAADILARLDAMQTGSSRRMTESDPIRTNTNPQEV